MIEIEPIGNQLTLDAAGNFISLELFDVFTDRYYISQFQMSEDYVEVLHEDIH